MKKIFWFILRLAYKKIGTSEISERTVLHIMFFQKLLGINRHVPWPVHWSSRVEHPDNITIGTEYPGIMPGCYITARNGIVLGDNVQIGPNVHIVSSNHDILEFEKQTSNNPIIIGKNSWIGAGAIILPGITLGEHTIVGAGSVVTKSFTDRNQLIAGNPARKIKDIEKYRN